MFRKLSETFTATHFTVLAALAILAPSALYAIPSFTNVAIEDPNTGSRAFVLPSRALSVFDGVAGYANNPANSVNIFFGSGNGSCGQIYTVPAGKALVMREISLNLRPVTVNAETNTFIYRDASCNQIVVGGASSEGTGSQWVVDPLGTGVSVPAGSKLYSFSVNGNSVGIFRGYLVPAAAVPAAGSAEAADLQGESLPMNRTQLLRP